MFPELPIELQAEIATYLDVPSLCFFARTSWRSLRAVQPHLMRCQQQLLRSPPIKLEMAGWGLFCYTSNVIYACGGNSFGQLGLGHTNACTTFTRLGQQPPGAIRQVVSGAYYTLVLTDQGLYACGENSYGRLGLRHTDTCTIFTRLPQPPGTIQQVVVGSYHILVLSDQGLYACGVNNFGQLGLGHTSACTTFTRLEQQPPGVILQVVASSSHTLVLTDQGLYACGANGFGQLRLGHTNACTTFTCLEQQLPGVILQVAAGWLHTLVFTDHGLYACGANRDGQLGLGDAETCMTLTYLPQQPPGVILQIASSNFHTLVLTDHGLYAFGGNNYGQLGLGHTNTCTTITRLPQQPPGAILQVVAGYYHTLVLTDQGLYACGDNKHGQLGLGHSNRCTTFTRLEQQPSGVILQVVAGLSHTLVLTDQKLYACGDMFGRLRLGHTNACIALTLVDQVPSELRQFQALYRQLNALIRLSQTESPLPQPKRLNPSGNSLPQAKKSRYTELDDLEPYPKRTKFFP